MYDTTLVVDLLEEMVEATEKIIYRCSKVTCMDDFTKDEAGQILLDSICMLLIATGEAVKKLDKLTDQSLLARYPNVPWKEIPGMRDILSHHYFDLNAEAIYNVCQDHIKPLNYTLKTMHKTMQEENR